MANDKVCGCVEHSAGWRLLREIWAARKKYGMTLLGWLECIIMLALAIPWLVWWQLMEWWHAARRGDQ